MPKLEAFAELLKGSGRLEMSTTMGFVRLLSLLLRDKAIGRQIVPIIPDEARTFGMDALFREIGIYSPKGQLYEPVDRKSLLYYHETKDGQILEEGITEAGAMASFIAAGTAYATQGRNMIPFYIYYSMFGFQRIGDLMWLAGDIRAKGFLLGATSGRTTLNGEGLQHQDGHSLLLASTIPTLLTYDPAFAYEIAVIIDDGMRRMYRRGRGHFLLPLALQRELPHAADARGRREASQGPLQVQSRPRKARSTRPTFSAAAPSSARLARPGNPGANSTTSPPTSGAPPATSCSATTPCSTAALEHAAPDEPPRKSYLEQLLENETGVFVAVSDNIKIVPDQIAPWVPGGLTTLGTDGFGRSDTRESLRRFFEMDAECTVIATLHALAGRGQTGTRRWWPRRSASWRRSRQSLAELVV